MSAEVRRTLNNDLDPVKSNENVTERRSFSQMKMLPGCPSPFFDFDDLGGAGLKS